MSETLADRLRNSREEARLSQSELARRVGVSPQAIQHLEAGKSNGSRHLIAIAGVLGVSPGWLSSGEGEARRRGRHFVLPLDPSGVDRSSPESLDTQLSGRKDPEQVVFKRKNIKYLANTLPVLIATSYRRAEMPSIVFTYEERQLRSWLSENADRLTSDEMDLIVRWEFKIIPERQPSELTLRPHYLRGQVEAYALYLDDPCKLTKRVAPIEILHVSPYRRPEYTDLVIVWHKSNAFIVGEFYTQTAETIEIEHPDLHERYPRPFTPEYDQAQDQGTFPTLKLPLAEVEAIHTVVGAEFVLPQSAQTRSAVTRIRNARRFLESQAERPSTNGLVDI